jgi:hypothetical protein
LDYIFVSPLTRLGAGRIHSCKIICTEPDDHGDRCSDHYGLMADVSLTARDNAMK